jgi:putative transposase
MDFLTTHLCKIKCNRRYLGTRPNSTSMSFTRVIVHAVWGTQNRQPFLTSEIRSTVIEHIEKNAEMKNLFVHRLNGHVDHLHCLFTLNTDTSLAKTLQLIKGESSFWINKNRLTKHRFEWAEEYYACP